MGKNDLVVFCLDWIALHSPALVDVLMALSPVLSLAVAGYALHVVARREREGSAK